MSNEIKGKKEYEKYARDHRKELDAQEVRLGDVVTVLVGHFAGEKGVIVGMIACDKSDYAAPYYEIEMECDVPEEFRVRKTLVGQSHVIGGVEKRHLKIIGNLAPKQQTDEIKVGDRVRVREDVPKVYLRGWGKAVEYNVNAVYGDAAVITYGHQEIAIPLKYLIKIEEEKKEPKFKVNDVVRTVFNETTHITSVLENGNYYLYGMGNEYPEDSLTLVEPYTEPTEQTEAEKSFEDQLRDVLNGVGHQDYGHPIHTAMINLDINDWDAYAADLAKEVALKVANKFNDSKEAAEYAVSVAKAVVEGLKRK